MKKTFFSIIAICLLLFFYKVGYAEKNDSENSMDNQEIIEREINQDNNIDTETVNKKIRIFERIQKLKDKKETKIKIVKFYNNKNTIKKIIELKNGEKETLSKNGKYLGVLRYEKSYDKNDININKIIVYSEEGKSLFEKKIENLNNLLISNLGSFIIHDIVSSDNRANCSNMIIYDDNATVKTKLKFGLKYSIISSQNGDYLFVLAREYSEKGSGGATVYLICFNENYDEIWQKKINSISYHNMLTDLHFDGFNKKIIIKATEGEVFKNENIIPVKYEFNLSGELLSKQKGEFK